MPTGAVPDIQVTGFDGYPIAGGFYFMDKSIAKMDDK